MVGALALALNLGARAGAEAPAYAGLGVPCYTSAAGCPEYPAVDAAGAVAAGTRRGRLAFAMAADV